MLSTMKSNKPDDFLSKCFTVDNKSVTVIVEKNGKKTRRRRFIRKLSETSRDHQKFMVEMSISPTLSKKYIGMTVGKKLIEVMGKKFIRLGILDLSDNFQDNPKDIEKIKNEINMNWHHCGYGRNDTETGNTNSRKMEFWKPPEIKQRDWDNLLVLGLPDKMTCECKKAIVQQCWITNGKYILTLGNCCIIRFLGKEKITCLFNTCILCEKMIKGTDELCEECNFFETAKKAKTAITKNTKIYYICSNKQTSNNGKDVFDNYKNHWWQNEIGQEEIEYIPFQIDDINRKIFPNWLNKNIKIEEGKRKVWNKKKGKWIVIYERNCDICSKTLKLKKLTKSHRFEDVMILFIPDMEKENNSVLKACCMKCYNKINNYIGKIEKFEPKYEKEKCIMENCDWHTSTQNVLNGTPFCCFHINCKICNKKCSLDPEKYEKDPQRRLKTHEKRLCEDCFREESRAPFCRCGEKSKRKKVRKPGRNKGKYFFTCQLDQHDDDNCRFFMWDKKKLYDLN